MWKYFAFSAIGVLLLSGCSHRQIMLSKLKESGWYKSQAAWATPKDAKGLRLSSRYIFAGQIKELRYDYSKKTISNIILSPSHCLLAPTYLTEWFGPDPMWIVTSNAAFKKGYFPVVGEYWAFGIIKGLKGRYSIKSAVKLLYDKNTEDLAKVNP